MDIYYVENANKKIYDCCACHNLMVNKDGISECTICKRKVLFAKNQPHTFEGNYFYIPMFCPLKIKDNKNELRIVQQRRALSNSNKVIRTGISN